MKLSLTILIALFYSLPVVSQYPLETQHLAEDIYEFLMENTPGLEDNELLERLQSYIENPLDINFATRDELTNAPFLSGFQVESIWEYREKYGIFYSINELSYVFGFTSEFIGHISPLVLINSKKQAPFLLKNLGKGKHDILMRVQQTLEDQKGFLVSDSLKKGNGQAYYLGDPYKLYTRYRYTCRKNIFAGFTLEKDAGEEFFKGSNRNAFDFQSWHIQMSDYKFIKQLVIGDYRLCFGQGLVVWNGFYTGKNGYSVNLVKYARGVDKYTSVNENQFFRGVATTLRAGRMEFSLFYSAKPIDASVDMIDSLGGPLGFSSFTSTGIHHTINELSEKDKVWETVLGGAASFAFGNKKVGLTYIRNELDIPLQSGNIPYQNYSFEGMGNQVLGFNYQWNSKKILLFGETAYSMNGGMGNIHGVTFMGEDLWELSLLYRHYTKDFWSLYGKPYSTFADGQNEKGWYAGIKFYPFKQWEVMLYADLYRHEWLRYGMDSPGNGKELFIQVNYKYGEHFHAYFRYHPKQKIYNIISDSLIMRKMNMISTQKYRLHCSYQAGDHIQFVSRLEMKQYQKETGYMMFQDISFLQNRWKFSFRYSVFDTPSFKSGIYAYEKDVLWSFSIPVYHGEGTRFYGIVQYKLSDRMNFWVRYARFDYLNLSSIGSGLAEIKGNIKSEIKVQLRIRI